MPRLVEKALSDQAIKKLRPKEKRYEVKDSIIRGLSIRINPSGKKSWSVMSRVNGRNVRVHLGDHRFKSLKTARLDAAIVLNEMEQGTYKKHQSSGLIEDIFEDWLKRDQAGNKSRDQVERAMRKDALPAWRGRHVDSITQADIIALLDKVADRGAETQANRLAAYIKRFFNWLEERGELEHSPAAKVRPSKKEVSRDRVLSEDELAKVWQAASERRYPFGPMFRLLILTGQRLNEVASAEWSEFDLSKKIWTIPGSRAKNGQKHIVHLSDEAVTLVESLPRLNESPYLFTTNRKSPVSGFSKAKAALDRECGVTNWRIHDLRRTFATVATGELSIAPHVIDKILNHVSGAVKGVAAVYQRTEYLKERQEAIEQWGEYIILI